MIKGMIMGLKEKSEENEKMRVKADYKIEHITDAEYHNNLKNNILKLLMDLKKLI